MYQEILKPGIISGPRNTPAAQEIIFVWMLFGNTGHQKSTNEVTTGHVSVEPPGHAPNYLSTLSCKPVV
jgi:hypothetical protein